MKHILYSKKNYLIHISSYFTLNCSNQTEENLCKNKFIDNEHYLKLDVPSIHGHLLFITDFSMLISSIDK